MSEELKTLLESMFNLSQTKDGGFMIERIGGNDEMAGILEFDGEKDLIEDYGGKSALVMLDEYNRDVISHLHFDDEDEDDQDILEGISESMLDMFEDLETILENYCSSKKNQ